MSALFSTTRRVLGGAAISAVMLGAGSGMAFAGEIDNSDAVSGAFGDQANAAVAGNGGGAGDGDVDADGGNGGDGGSVGENNPTQNYLNQQQLNAIDQICNIEGDGDCYQSVVNNFYANANQQGANSSYESTDGVIDEHDEDCPQDHPASEDCPEAAAPVAAEDCPEEEAAPVAAEDCPEDEVYEAEDTDEAEDITYEAADYSAAEDLTPVGAADTGDGSFVPASQSSGLGGDLAAGGAISAAALLAAYGVSVARRRHSAHAAL